MEELTHEDVTAMMQLNAYLAAKSTLDVRVDKATIELRTFTQSLVRGSTYDARPVIG